MSTINQHIQNMKHEIAQMTMDGHLIDFEIIGCAGAIEHECDTIMRISRENEEFKNEV